MNKIWEERQRKVNHYREEAKQQADDNIPIEERDSIIVSDIIKSSRGWLYCVKCAIPMKVQKNDVAIVTDRYTNGSHTDTYKCPKCECLISKARNYWY